MTDLLTLAANHPWWFTLWLGMTYATIVATAEKLRGKVKP